MGRWRYTIPYEHSFEVPLKLKHEQKELTLAQLLASTYPQRWLSSEVGQADTRATVTSKSIAFWTCEIREGRVQYLRHSESRDDVPMWTVLPPTHIMGRSTRNGRLRIHVHVHEQRIVAKLPEILYLDQRIVVVNKPAGVPCTSSGRPLTLCRANVVDMISDPSIVGKAHVPGTCAPAHRLDKPVSGIFVLGRSKRVGWQLGAALSSEGAVKRYLARVRGQFPEQPMHVEQPLRMAKRVTTTSCSFVDYATAVPVPTDTSDGLKPAHTTFLSLSYDSKSDTTLVEARLHSGRRHQIRAHLASIGHPIANDSLYATRSNDLSSMSDHLCAESAQVTKPTSDRSALPVNGIRDLVAKHRAAHRSAPWCQYCDQAIAYLDNLHDDNQRPFHQDQIWLHAFEYQFKFDGQQYCFRAALPDFAQGTAVPDSDPFCGML